MRQLNRLCVGALLAGLGLGAGVTDVQAVYLLPMSGGLDQHLANRLTATGVFRVVTDPKMADAVFTDQIGAGFEQRLVDLYKPEQDSEDSDKAENSKAASRTSSFGHGRGTIFLVDVKSRAVIWSAYQKPSKATSGDLDRTAVHIVEQIKKQQKAK
jgi:hypothetical protein